MKSPLIESLKASGIKKKKIDDPEFIKFIDKLLENDFDGGYEPNSLTCTLFRNKRHKNPFDNWILMEALKARVNGCDKETIDEWIYKMHVKNNWYWLVLQMMGYLVPFEYVNVWLDENYR